MSVGVSSNAVLSSKLSPFGCNPKKAGEEISKNIHETRESNSTSLSNQCEEINCSDPITHYCETCSKHLCLNCTFRPYHDDHQLVDLRNFEPEDEIKEIAAATNIQLDFLTAALDEEEKSRVEIEDDQILILVDIPFFRSNKDYDTMPLGIIVTDNYLVTICLEPNAVTAAFNESNFKLFSTLKHTRFLFQILYKSATLYLKYIRIISRRTDELEKHLRQSMENSELFNLLSAANRALVF